MARVPLVERAGPGAGSGSGSGQLPAMRRHAMPVPKKTTSGLGKKVAQIAKGYVGRHFDHNARERCAAFVRHVLKEAGGDVGVAARPTDFPKLPADQRHTNPNIADSFAGNDVGRLIPVHQRAPGDLILYMNTYGNYPRGVITHVAIYVGNDTIVHRPTAARPVGSERYDYAAIAEVRRPITYKSESAPTIHKSVKVFMHDGMFRAFRNGCEIKNVKIDITANGNQLSVRINGSSIDPEVIDLQIFA